MSAGDAFLRIWNLLDWRIAIVIAQQQLQLQQQNLGLDLVIAGNHHHPNWKLHYIAEIEQYSENKSY